MSLVSPVAPANDAARAAAAAEAGESDDRTIEAQSAPESAAEDPGITALFVRRPVLAIVLNLLIIVAGLAAFAGVEVRELPNVDRPVISVRTTYEGASAETVDAQVTSILEDALAQTPGLASISSSSDFGGSRVTLEFSSAGDVDQAASDVRDIVSRLRDLPEEADTPIVAKSDADAQPIMRLSLVGNGVDIDTLTRIAEDQIAETLGAVDGVAEIGVYGDRRDVMRVTILPIALSSRGLTVADLRDALADVSLDAPTGTLETATQNLVVRSEAIAQTAEEIADIYIDDNTRVGDVAFVERAPDDEASSVRTNGAPSLGLEVVRQAQSNTLAISQAVRARLDDVRRDLPEGVELFVSSDDGVFIEGSIREVVIAIAAAGAIVVAVIFLFLGSLRAVLIPAVTIPVALIGTLAAVWAAGFSINTLTLLGLVLATGLVVDDAIIVLENIERRRREGLGRRAAAVLGVREVFFAVIATTAVLAAVFVPISFLPGQAGRLFQEFGFTLAFAVMVSSFTALTLVPMMAAKLNIGRPRSGRRSVFGFLLGSLGTAVARLYGGIVEVCLRLPLIVIAGAVLFGLYAFSVYRDLPQEITPQEDRGYFFTIVSAPTSASLEYTASQVRLVEDILVPYREAGEIDIVLSLVGRGSSNRAFVVARLTDWESGRRPQGEIQGDINRALQDIPGVRVFARSGNSLGIRGGGGGLSFAVAGADYDRLAELGDEVAEALNAAPGFLNASASFDVSQAQLAVAIDRARVSDLGISLDAITTTLRTMIAGTTAAELFIGDDIVEVRLEAGGRPVDDQTDLENLFVRTESGAFVPLSSVVTITERAAAPELEREGRARAVQVQSNLDGINLGEAVERMREITAPILGDEGRIVLLGEAASLEESNRGVLLVFGAALVIVLLVLAAQFESAVSALVIVLTVPFGLGAAALALAITGTSLNIYSQIGLVMLVGIMAKNGILVVEFADQLRDRGRSVRDAIREAARLRFRPVMMTMTATVVGGVPLLLGTGAGAEARAAIGWVVVGGLTLSALFTLFLVPALYVLLAPLTTPRADEERRLREELAGAARPS